MTSIYPLPFFFGLAVPFAPALFIMAGPNKSSIELALLMPVPGLLGGALGGLDPTLPLETVRAMIGGAKAPGPSD